MAILGQNARTRLKEYQVWLFWLFWVSRVLHFQRKKKNTLQPVSLGTIIKNTRTTKKVGISSNEPPKQVLFRSHSEVHSHFLTWNLYQSPLWYWLDHSSLPQTFVILWFVTEVRERNVIKSSFFPLFVVVRVIVRRGCYACTRGSLEDVALRIVQLALVSFLATFIVKFNTCFASTLQN